MRALKEFGLDITFKFLVYNFVLVFYYLIINHLILSPPARKLFLQLLKSKIGKDSILMDIKFFNWHHKGPEGFKVGNQCFIGDETLIDLYDSVILKDQVTIAQRVTILTHLNVGYKDHPLQKYFPKKSKPVIFENCSVIGAGAIILPGVTIGEESFVAAGSVVTKNVPKRTLVAGVPAKVIRKLSRASLRVSEASL